MEFSQLIKISQINDVKYCLPHQEDKKGKLLLNDYHMAIIDENEDDVYMPHKLIDCVIYRSTGAYAEVNLKLKDFTQVKLVIPSNEQARLLAQSLSALSSVENIIYSLAFHYRPQSEFELRGWQCASLTEEYSRRFAYGDWRISTANKDYKLCPSYSEALIVPKGVDDDILFGSAKCREGGRIAIPVYCHVPIRSILLRSGQMLTSDYKYLGCLLPPKYSGHVRDTRSDSDASLALQRSGNSEGDQPHPLWRKKCMGIESWDKVNESFRTFINACVNVCLESKEWTNSLLKCEWFDQIQKLLYCSAEVAGLLHSALVMVLVHDGEGSDTTLVITSLVQVILDPDARTLLGFQALIEREWLQGGHRFADRCNKGPFNTTPRTESPIFLQFIDCVWQIYQQYPSAFQFNSTFLLHLCKHVYCSEFGTFLCNNDQERKRFGVYENTVSLWCHMNHQMEKYMNPVFSPVNSNHELKICWPSTSPQSLKLWRELYFKDLFDFSKNAAMENELMSLKEDNRILKTDVVAMRRLLSKLLKEAEELDLLDKVKK